MRVEKTIFISYRRTNVYNALAIYQNLIHNGYDVFFDYDSIKSGDFAQIILNQIAARAHFVVLLTPSALERCNEPGDWLRKEIEHAIELKRNIVPLMFEGFSFKDVDQYLTGKMAVLKSYNAMTVPIEYFDAAMEKLRNKFLNVALEAVIHPMPPAQQAQVAQIQTQAASQPHPTEKQLGAEEYLENGNKQYEAGNLDQAIADFSEAIRLNPQFAGAYMRRALVRIIEGDPDGAIADCTEAIHLNPRDVNQYLVRGSAYLIKDDFEGAIADYTQAIRLNPQNTNAYVGRGLARDSKGDHKNAIADLSKAIRLNPQDASAYNYRGLVRFAKFDFDRAIADYEAALRIDPDYDPAKENLQIALDIKNNTAEI